MDLDLMLRAAVEHGASDVHLKRGQPPVVRIDGELVPLAGYQPLVHADLEAVLAAVCADTESKRRAFEETGELDISFAPPTNPRFRVNGYRQRGTISFAFRQIPNEVPTFAELRLPPGVARLADEQRGLILATGATGVGKTTTLASIVDYINRTRRVHIVTVEDPIEILHEDRGSIIDQREVGFDTASFHEALRRLPRQDPDVILIGEMRDEESAEAALQAADSGHLVLSTMHTIGAAETIGRFIEFFPAAKQPQVRAILANCLRGIVSQRLLTRKDGGRVAAVEVLVTNARISSLIREDRADQIAEAIAEGQFLQMQTFMQALIELVLAGEVDQEVAVDAATNRHDFQIALDFALKRQAADLRNNTYDESPRLSLRSAQP
jgi:twitching motility protein PilT